MLVCDGSQTVRDTGVSALFGARRVQDSRVDCPFGVPIDAEGHRSRRKTQCLDLEHCPRSLGATC